MGNCWSNSPKEKDSNIEMIDELKQPTFDLDSDGGIKDITGENRASSPNKASAEVSAKPKKNKKKRDKENDVDGEKKKKSAKSKKEKKAKKDKVKVTI